MKFLFRLVLLCLLSSISYAQTVYQIRADSVRIYSGCDTAELIIENHTQDTTGFLFNKGKGRTEFRKLRLKMLADNSLAIVGQDTLALGTGFVRLQTAVNQPGGFSVAGSGFSTAQFQVKRDGSDAVSGGLALFNAIQTRGAIFQLNGDVNPGVSTWIHNGSAWVKRMEINSGSGVVDMPYGFIGGNTSKIRGADTLDFTQSYLQFMRADGATRMGLVGMASKSNKDLYLISEQGKVNIYPNNNSLTGYLSVEPNNLLYSGGTVTLANATSNMLSFVGGGTGVPSFLPRSVGTKLVLGNTIGSASVDHAMGVESSNTWLSVPQQNSTFGIKFYGGTTEIGRISGVGVSEWAGQGRFKGWADTTVRGVAAEIGMIYGAATFIGADRTVSPAKYMPVVIRGGSSATNSKGFGIDSIGYRLIEFRNVGVLGTDANGYLVNSSGSFIQNQQSAAQAANSWVTGYSSAGAVRTTAAINNGDFLMYSGTNLTPSELRWAIFKSGAEAAGNVGADFAIKTYDSLGAGLSTPLVIKRSTGEIRLGTILAETTDVDKFLVSNGGNIRYRTGAQMLSDIGGAAANINLSSVLTNSVTTKNTIALGVAGDGTQYNFQTTRNIGTLNATASFGVSNTGTNIGGAFISTGDGNSSTSKIFYLNNTDAAPLYSPDNGVNKYAVWHSNNHPAGKVFTLPLTGANVLASFTTNEAGHVTAATTRSLTPTDIAAAPASGSANYIQNQPAAIQTGSFNLTGAGALGGNLTVGGNETVTGSVTSTGFYQSSLRALKMNIKTCELNATRIIDSLKIREFEYKKDPGKKVVGIIADDEPSIVSGEKHDHLDMMNAVGLLLKSVQELNARLDKLEQQINKEHTSK